MMMELIIFAVIAGLGGAVWFLLNYLLAVLFNWYAVYYPAYFADPVIAFLIGVADYGVLIICLIPAAIYLITNTQRPEARR